MHLLTGESYVPKKALKKVAWLESNDFYTAEVSWAAVTVHTWEYVEQR